MNNKIAKIQELLFTKSFWWFAYFIFRFYGRKRNQHTSDVHFLGYNVSIPDGPSFLWQFKDLFVDKILDFSTQVDAPILYDCGSNTGLSTIAVKRQYPQARVVAFEADAHIAQYSRDNFTRNNIHAVEIVEAAVWTHSNGINFTADGADGGSIYGNGNKKQVPSIRLKDYLQKEQHIDLLAIDIEGAEVAVLQDCESELHRVQNIFVEYHSFSEKQQELSKLIAILERTGFRYYMEPVQRRMHPLLNKQLSKKMDMQVNIFAYRV